MSTTLYVDGRKDNVRRRVQHIPLNADVKETPAEGGKHFWMLLGDPGHAVPQRIAKDRIIKVTDTRHGIPH